MDHRLNRLTPEDALEWDKMFKEFCEAENHMMKCTLRESHSCPEPVSLVQEEEIK